MPVIFNCDSCAQAAIKSPMIQPMITDLVGHFCTPSPRANRFIVTLYGDVVEPRGGALWMGSLIDLCARQGISESLVRTAVSRLVISGHLEGERIGRRSYYRLSATAREEFSRAACLFYEPIPVPSGWTLALDCDAAPGRRWAQLGPRTYIASDIPDDMPRTGIVLAAQPVLADGKMAKIATDLWSLNDLADQYRQFIDLFAALDQHIGNGGIIGLAEALMLRLQLVHRFRLIVLQDPRLPECALGPRWPGVAARKLFAGIYLSLAESADQYVARSMSDSDGYLPLKTCATSRRLVSLRQV